MVLYIIQMDGYYTLSRWMVLFIIQMDGYYTLSRWMVLYIIQMVGTVHYPDGWYYTHFTASTDPHNVRHEKR